MSLTVTKDFFWCAWNVVYLDLGGNYICIYLWKHSLSSIFKISVLCMLYLNLKLLCSLSLKKKKLRSGIWNYLQEKKAFNRGLGQLITYLVHKTACKINGNKVMLKTRLNVYWQSIITQALGQGYTCTYTHIQNLI